MRLAILHLSDIHIKGSQDRILTRAKAIAVAASRITSQSDAILVLCTGDIAFSGTADQYVHASALFRAINDEIRAQLAPAKTFLGTIVMPGNHDCDFSAEMPGRLSIIDAALSKPSDVSVETMKACVAPQAAFEAFRRQLEEVGVAPRPQAEGPLATRYEWVIGTYPVALLCCNTAWVSMRKETPGRLVLPEEIFGSKRNDPGLLTITCLHHPTHWMEAANRRRIRDKLEMVSDVIITAHEHEATERDIEARHNGATYLEIEAPVLQDRDDDQNSSFQVLVVDLRTRQRRRYEFCLARDNHYEVDPADDDGNAHWQELLPNQLRIRRAFAFSEEHRQHLDEMELSLHHSGSARIGLSDLFVWPDLREVSINPNVTGRVIRGDKVPDSLLSADIALLTGDARSGKTALAKMLCVKALESGSVPVLLKSERMPRKKQVIQDIEKEFVRQYSVDALDAYRELPRQRRVLIVDDFHQAARSRADRREYVRLLSDHAGVIVLLADESEVDLTEVITGEGAVLPRFALQEFGFTQRGELIDRWVKLGDDPDVRQARIVADLEKRIVDVLGKNFVPSYPLFILALLQASEGSLPADTRVGTYGAYYELLIRSQLMKGNDQKEFSTLVGYLSFIAYRMYQSRQVLAATRAEFHALHEEYEEWSDLTLSEDAILRGLSERQVLRVRQDNVAFRYPYVGFYFLASYIRDHVDKEEIRTLVTTLANQTYRRESADVLLFVAHLTRERFVVEALLKAAGAQYDDVTPLRNLAGLAVIDGIPDAAVEVAYREKDARNALREKRERNDGIADAAEKDADVDDELIRPIARLTGALRVMQVLGQVLRNFPGQLSADEKLDIARACYGTGARAWAFVFSLFDAHREELAVELTDGLLRQEPQISRKALADRVKKIGAGLVHVAALGFVKRIAQSIGAPELTKTFDKMLQEERCETARLVKIAVSLEHASSTPELEVQNAFADAKGSPLAQWLIKELVVEHLFLSDLDTRGRQRLCESVEVKYQGLLTAHTRRRRDRPKKR